MQGEKRLADPPADPVVRKLRSEIGAHERHGNDQAAAAARRKLAIHQLGKQIREVVASAPPLSPEDAAMLRGLLAPVPAGGGANAA